MSFKEIFKFTTKRKTNWTPFQSFASGNI